MQVRGLFGLVAGGAKAVGKGILPRAWGNYANDYQYGCDNVSSTVQIY